MSPADDAAEYAGKAATTAEAARSVVETVALITESAFDGKLFGPFADVSISEQEDLLDDVQGDFRSIQPPDATSDDVRERLDDVLTEAVATVADVRIALRRNDTDTAAQVAASLPALSAAFARFEATP